MGIKTAGIETMGAALQSMLTWLVRYRRHCLAAIVIVLALLPLFGLRGYYIRLVMEMLTYGLWAISLDIMIGFTGLVSFGHAAFFGLGVYSTALLITKAGVSLLPALLGGVAVSSVAAVLIGIVIVRLSGIAFALLTLASSMILFTVFWRWSALTGGDDGMSVPRPDLELLGLSVNMQADTSVYWFVLAMVLLGIYFAHRVVNSPAGAALVAIRENHVRAECVGYNIFRYKLLAFTISGTLAGMAGSLYVIFQGFASPDLLHWSSSGQVLIMTILGGIGTLYGPFIGAGLVVLLQDKLSSLTEHWMLPLGLIFVLVIRFLPKGLLGMVRLGSQR
ncbi:MAG: branched-chain amino acid ABC transporter permease [Reyranellaceae bacterium]